MKYIALDNLNIKDKGVLFVRLKLSLGSDFAMFFFLDVLLLALRILDSGICKCKCICLGMLQVDVFLQRMKWICIQRDLQVRL